MNTTGPRSTDSGRLFRHRIHDIIFHADTPAGKLFDVVLLITILVSVVTTCIETVEQYNRYDRVFSAIDLTITILFSVEFALRIWSVERRSSYLFSFYGIVDLLAIFPFYIGFALQGQYTAPFAVIRSLRLLRFFRVFELGWFVSEANSLSLAFWQSRAKIVVFLFTIAIIVTLAGTGMYLLEGNSNEKLVSIPDGIYWAIVTMTTVGYGDVVPTTPLGKIMSAVLILLGYSLIIVPTGFVSAEFVHSRPQPAGRLRCPKCGVDGHATDAAFCRRCGQPL